MYKIQANASGTRSINVSEEHLATIKKYSLLKNLIDSTGFIDESVLDKLKLNMREYFEKKNPAALQEMTAVLMETARKGLWKTDAATLKQIAQLHAELVRKFGPGCSGFVCNNAKLREFIARNLADQPLKQEYSRQIERVRTPSGSSAQPKDKKEDALS